MKMIEKQVPNRYAAIDYFRVIAAFFIVAIHVGPLASLNETMDYFIVYCIGRVGVPFFFMVTGFFVIAPFMEGKPLRIKKTILLYAISILLYFPISWYSENLPEGIGEGLRQLFFDGTFYHLWYFPAVILGTCITAYLLRCFGYGVTGIITVLFYIIGVLGDSWYGAISQMPIFESFYKTMFTIFSYTRNGIFFAPVFLYLGAVLARRKANWDKAKCVLGLTISLLLLLIEGSYTYFHNWQKHNSMYFALLPVMIFLFLCLLAFSNQGSGDTKHLRNLSMWIYLIHPICIIVVRGIAKVLKMTELMVENSLVHYILVCILSVVTALLFQKIKAIGGKWYVSKSKGMD